MSIENFCESLRSQLTEYRREREKTSGSAKGQFTRKINDLEAALVKATRKGIQ